MKEIAQKNNCKREKLIQAATRFKIAHQIIDSVSVKVCFAITRLGWASPKLNDPKSQIKANDTRYYEVSIKFETKKSKLMHIVCHDLSRYTSQGKHYAISMYIDF